MPPMTGRVVAGRYNLQHPIGRGAMGVVWRARDQLLDRDVAVKEVVISAMIGEDERRNAYQRTLREARTAARLSHRGVVAVYDVAEEDGRPWIIMELVPSRSLDQVLTVEKRLTSLRTGRVGQQLLSALAAAHAAGVLHRDVKPSNVLIATDRSGSGWDERAVLTDFGIAQFEGDPRLTQTGMVMGSPGFTAPERIRGGDATPASDLWSLGATLYAAVEGRGPYEQRGGAITTMSAIINEDAPVAIHAGQLAPVIGALLRREPSARPAASAAARMFAQVLPQLEAIDRARQGVHPPTVRSSYVQQPTAVAVPVPSVSVPPADAAPSDPAPAPEPESSSEAEPTPGPAPTVVVGVADETDAAADAPEVAAESEASEPEASEPEASEPELASEAEQEPEPEAEPDAELVREAERALELETDADSPVSAAEEATAAGDSEDAGDPAEEEASAAKAAAVMLVEAPPSSEAGETMIDRGSAGYRPTELSIPVQKPMVAKPAPAPTFTASRPGQRAAPTFSAVRQNHSVTAQPRPQPPKPTYGAAQPEVAQKGAYSKTTSPFPGSGGQYAGPEGRYAGSSGQYAGPSQPYSDLSRQYTPGSGGGRTQRGSGPWRWIILVILAAILAAAIGAGAAFALHHSDAGSGTGTNGSVTTADAKTQFLSVNALNQPTTVVPAGWTPVQVTVAQTNSNAAGFAIDLPPNWKEGGTGLGNHFYGPSDMSLEIDLTPHTYPNNMVREARYIARRSSPSFTGYRQLNLQAVPVRSTTGALWQFNETNTGVLTVADDILFVMSTQAGKQSYAILIQGPSAGWGSTYLPVFEKMLRTFQIVSASQ